MTNEAIKLPLCSCGEFYESHHPECPARRAYEMVEAENFHLKIALQNYMDACRYADKESLMSAIAAADKRAIELVPYRLNVSILC